MPDAPHPKAAAAPSGLLGRLRSSLQPARERITSGIASTLTGVLNAAGLKLEIEATPPSADAQALPQVVPQPQPRGPLSPLPTMSPLPVMPGLPVAAAPARPVVAPLSQPYPLTPPPPRGPTQVQVMTAVQRAVSGAVKVVSGTVDGVRAAGAAARAASTTATGAGAVASGVATVASGFFPQLAALGIGVPKAPKNRPGMRPQRRVADIIANPMGRAPQPAGPGEPARPVRRVQRLPMVRPKSSLALTRNENRPKLRTYSDLQMRPQIGLTPHEILLKVATITLGKTLLGFLEAGARSQQQALQRVGARMSEKQIMLLGMLPAQYIAMRMPPTPVAAEAPPTPSARPSSDPASPAQPSASSSASGAFKIRY